MRTMVYIAVYFGLMIFIQASLNMLMFRVSTLLPFNLSCLPALLHIRHTRHKYAQLNTKIFLQRPDVLCNNNEMHCFMLIHTLSQPGCMSLIVLIALQSIYSAT